MPKQNHITIEEATERIASLVEKGLAKLPPKARNERLQKIHSIASNAVPRTDERASGHSETLQTALGARPRGEF